ncbi:hypothetical protein [Candidatus Palauibacter sp.]|uniref:hypothetical protein n=1 Tax=Candidatus Palauibacter sp. TaxID=3101350 RepID=UPI003B023F1D
MRRFNTAGPARADEHYCVPPLDRVSLAGVPDLIRFKAYFALVRRPADGEDLRPAGAARPAERRRRGGVPERGLEQTAAYMDLSDADAGRLVIFDMREGRTWAENVARRCRHSRAPH